MFLIFLVAIFGANSVNSFHLPIQKKSVILSTSTDVYQRSNFLKIYAKSSLADNDEPLEDASCALYYDENGVPLDDVLVAWSRNESDMLVNSEYSLGLRKLIDPYENALISIVVSSEKSSIPDKVIHFYETRGPTTRFYTVLGKNSNGIDLLEFNKSLEKSLQTGFVVFALEFGVLAFLGSGTFASMIHQLNSDATSSDVLTTTGVLGLFSQKFLDIILKNGAQGLNPFFHFKSKEFLETPKLGSAQIDYTEQESISDIINKRLDLRYKGFLKQGGLNPELRISFKNIRSKSDANWVREIKSAILEISKKRAKLCGFDTERESSSGLRSSISNDIRLEVNLVQNFYNNEKKEYKDNSNFNEVMSVVNEFLNDEENILLLKKSLRKNLKESGLLFSEKVLDDIIDAAIKSIEEIY